MSTDESFGGFGTDDPDWWNWMLHVIDVFLYAARVIAFALLTTGGAIASAVMLGHDKSFDYGRVTLAVTAVFAIGFVASVFRLPRTR